MKFKESVPFVLDALPLILHASFQNSRQRQSDLLIFSPASACTSRYLALKLVVCLVQKPFFSRPVSLYY